MLCTQCKNPEKEVVINLRYNGMHLCKRCFVEYFEHRIRKTIRKYSMINANEKIGVEISTKSNSAALLYFLKKFSDKRKISIIAIIDEIENDLIKILKTLNIEYFELEKQKLLELNLDKIAVGNNLDDEAGYALMNFLKGDIKIEENLYPIPIIKPLMFCPEKEVNLYAKINFPEINFESYYENQNKKFKEIINLLSENHPTVSFQIVKSNEELKRIIKKI